MEHRTYDDNVNPGTVLHIANLHPQTREWDLRALFSQFGRVVECVLVMDPHTGNLNYCTLCSLNPPEESRCFAFVTLETPEIAREIIMRMNGVPFHDRVLKVGLVRSLLCTTTLLNTTYRCADFS